MRVLFDRQAVLPSSQESAPGDADTRNAILQAAERPLIWKSCQVIGRILTTTLFDLKVYGLENIPRSGGAIIVSNHQSNLDPILLGSRMRRPLSYLAKDELFEINPAFTWLLRSLGGFPVRQGHGDVHALKESIERLRGGYLLNIYPEGARCPDGQIGAIEKGIALIGRRANVPVIPAVIFGAFKAWPIHRTFPRRWPIQVQFGPRMELANLAPPEIISMIDRTLRKMLAEFRSCPHPSC